MTMIKVYLGRKQSQWHSREAEDLPPKKMRQSCRERAEDGWSYALELLVGGHLAPSKILYNFHSSMSNQSAAWATVTPD